jgi:hypothetical protein
MKSTSEQMRPDPTFVREMDANDDGEGTSSGEEGADLDFHIVVKKLELPVRPRGVLAE